MRGQKMKSSWKILLMIVLVGCSDLWAQTTTQTATQKTDFAPRKHWRLAPSDVRASANSTKIVEAMKAGRDVTLEADEKGCAWIALELPERKKPSMLVFSPDFGTCRSVAEFSVGSAEGQERSWQMISDQTTSRLTKNDIPAHSGKAWLRVSFAPVDAKYKGKVFIGEVALFGIEPKGQNDFWLCVGASIQEQSIRNRVFKKFVVEKYGYDPVIFNEAIGGWTTRNLLQALPGFLKKYPYARYVTIHIGGNNISQCRPYPGGANELEKDLITILEMISKDGRIPILSRISYRAYKGDKPVPPESNGSGPYLVIYDRLIQKYCPDFFDAGTGKGMVDAYGWFKDHPEELYPDGVHVLPAGEISWNRLWAEKAGSVIYGSASPKK
jgi:lysophospholipase L1-like esterase